MKEMAGALTCSRAVDRLDGVREVVRSRAWVSDPDVLVTLCRMSLIGEFFAVHEEIFDSSLEGKEGDIDFPVSEGGRAFKKLWSQARDSRDFHYYQRFHL